MMRTVSIIALLALATLLSGCGCSREKKPVEESRVRMQDVAYTNKLSNLRSRQNKVASKAAAIRSELERLGKNAEKHPSYADLTNRLAQCEVESEHIRKAAQAVIRNRIMKDQSAKGNLKK